MVMAMGSMEKRLNGRCGHGIALENRCLECEAADSESLASAPAPAATPRLDREIEHYRAWWRTEAGKEARKWFEAWGLVQRERLDTGDPTAVPTTSGSTGVNRSSPSNISDVLLRFVEVDTFIRNRRWSDMHRRLMQYIYVESIIWADDGMLNITMKDGTTTQVHRGEDLPVQTMSIDYPEQRSYAQADLEHFKSDETMSFARLWGKSQACVLEREHTMIGQMFAISKLPEWRKAQL